ncbi:MAG TPA: alpha/beta hydrolase [Polyangiaceae bacterium LLY-WYZ-14_1]|nr:alpha/beta hydrolase [Polyangiaceae bacterium LLY-WYZ-14_1]
MTTTTESQATDLFREAPEKYIDVEGGSAVAYRRVGTGPDVLFVHGWPVTSGTYRRLLPRLAPHVTCHLIDLPGAGHSRFDRSTSIGIHTHIAAVRQVIDALGLESVALVGHDSGGLIARHAVAGDARLRSMVLLDTEQSQGLSLLFRFFLFMSRLPKFEAILAWTANQRTLRRSPLLLGGCFADKGLLDGEFSELFLEPLRDDGMKRWASGALIRSFERRYVDELAGVHTRITQPVRLVWGERDPFFPLAWAEEMVTTFPDATLHVVPQAKLFVHEEFPDQVAAAMLPTLLVDRSTRSQRAEPPDRGPGTPARKFEPGTSRWSAP